MLASRLLPFTSTAEIYEVREVLLMKLDERDGGNNLCKHSLESQMWLKNNLANQSSRINMGSTFSTTQHTAVHSLKN